MNASYQHSKSLPLFEKFEMVDKFRTFTHLEKVSEFEVSNLFLFEMSATSFNVFELFLFFPVDLVSLNVCQHCSCTSVHILCTPANVVTSALASEWRNACPQWRTLEILVKKAEGGVAFVVGE